MAKGPWFLYDQTQQKQWTDLDLTECLDTIKKLPAENWVHLHGWREDFSEWKPILEIPDIALSLQPKEEKKRAPPPPPPPPKTFKSASASAAKAQNQAAKPATDGSEKRKHNRAQVRLRVILRNEHLTFRTFTVDISLGGAALEHPIPPGLLAVNCQIYLADPETSQNIRFKAQIIQDRPDFRGIAFQELSPDDHGRIKAWIEKFGHKR